VLLYLAHFYLLHWQTSRAKTPLTTVRKFIGGFRENGHGPEMPDGITESTERTGPCSYLIATLLHWVTIGACPL